MRVTTRSRYAIRALYALAIAGGDKNPVSLKKISEMESISMKYLERLFSNLIKAGIVNSIRGVYGGYVFNKPLNEVTLLDVVEVMDGNIKPVDCIDDEGCERAESCSINWIWFELKNIIENYLSKITFYDLVHKKKNLMGV
ncbi:Rrf2 family transcriptional regulator [Deferribacter thermophilus]|uniref:RrF2 family transcriptional regulator n=1 Tax=Deferribacter thermophilus TaxID=53573 RepID=UPI003C21D65C